MLIEQTTTLSSDRIPLSGLEPTVFLSPDRKRTLDALNASNSSDADASTSLAFSEADMDEHQLQVRCGTLWQSGTPPYMV